MATQSIDTYVSRETADGEEEVPVTVEFSFSPGHPGHGPTYACGGTPPEPAEFEILQIYLRGTKFPVVLTDDETLRMYDWLADNYEDTSAADYADYLYDQRRDEQLEKDWDE